MLKFNLFAFNLDGFTFDSTYNLLTINSGSLKYVKNRQYEILVSTSYQSQEYTQKIRISIENVNILPVPILR